MVEIAQALLRLVEIAGALLKAIREKPGFALMMRTRR